MKAFIKYLLIFVFGIFTACKKDTTQQQINPLEGNVKSFTYYDNESSSSKRYQIIYSNNKPQLLMNEDKKLVEFISITATEIKANLYSYIQQGEEPITYVYDTFPHTISLLENKVVSIIGTKYEESYNSINIEYVNEWVQSYNAQPNFKLGIGSFPYKFYATNFVKDDTNIRFNINYNDIDAFFNIINKNSNIKFELSNEEIFENIIPLQNIVYLGYVNEFLDAGDCNLGILYLLALNGYQVGPPLEKYISKLYIDDNIYRVYEYEKDANGKVNKMHLKYTPEREPYATFAMEYY